MINETMVPTFLLASTRLEVKHISQLFTGDLYNADL